MKCRSVACIWSATPPSHKVTATAVLDYPPTLYTGGSDGSIIWWSISNLEIKAVAILCGHAATIADLGICYPVKVSENETTDDTYEAEVNSSSGNWGALISACTDGVLCVWSRRSGHCRRRRKLPAWVGSPSVVHTLPSKPRYVCIGCRFTESGMFSDHQSLDSMEGSDGSVDRESQHRKRSKCAIVIVDTYTLAIVQTVFHGILSFGLLRFMVVVSPIDDKETCSVVLSDSFGRIHMVSIPEKESHKDKEGGSGSHKSSHLEMTVLAEVVSETGGVVAVTTQGTIIAFLLYDRCIFKLLSNGVTIGNISFMENSQFLQKDSTKKHTTGCIFLDRKESENMTRIRESPKISRFVVWNSEGYAIVYMTSYLNDIFMCQPLCEIPALPCSSNLRSSIFFVQLSHCLLCIESLCYCVEEAKHWTPNIMIYEKCEDNGKIFQQCNMLCKGNYMVDWIPFSTSLHQIEDQSGREVKLSSERLAVLSSDVEITICMDDENHAFVSKGKVVTSSMVIPGSFCIPYAIVYGFSSGAIEVVSFDSFGASFDSFQATSPHCGSSYGEVCSNMPKVKFLGHTGAVLCLATHQMMGIAKGWTFKHVLLSGSMDCTVRVWDLDSGNIITIMHQHVAPVRQIILSPKETNRPWIDCFLSVGEDLCVALTSLETLRVERMFPGHASYPAKVVWDGIRGYVACLCKDHSGTADSVDVLYIWDVKTGSRERILRGSASHAMFDHFCRSISQHSLSDTALSGDTSASSLLLAIIEEESLFQSAAVNLSKSVTSANVVTSLTKAKETIPFQSHLGKGMSLKSWPASSSISQSIKHSIRCSSPFPGLTYVTFDLASLMSSYKISDSIENDSNYEESHNIKEQKTDTSSFSPTKFDDGSNIPGSLIDSVEKGTKSLEECLVRFSLSLLHLWNVDRDLDNLLITDMKLKRPNNFIVSSGLQGDKGSLTVSFPGMSSILELWKSSSEFCAMRSLTMVSLAQRMITLSHSGSAASSALAAFYSRTFAEKVPDMKPPLLQLLVSFWQDKSEHVRMAARSLFHCAASRSIPLPLCGQRSTEQGNTRMSGGASQNETEPSEGNLHQLETELSQAEDSNIRTWLESFELQDWISCVGGTSQDAMTSHIIVAAALAIWYPSLVKPRLSMLVIHPLVKLVMAMNERYSSTAAELIAEGMESTWKVCLGSEIHRLIEDIFFQIECVSAPLVNLPARNEAASAAIRETLVELLLPSLAMADIHGFLTVIESQIWSTSSDSSVHLVSLMTLVRVVRGCPRNLAQYLDKLVNFILHTMDPSNTVMRKTCFQSSMTVLKEVVHVFPMVALNDSWTRLAVGDVIGEIDNTSISVYDVQSVTKIKVLDASGPPGLPSLLASESKTMVTSAISALSFSPDGEGLVAFSEHGLMIRWWSLGSVWWEKLSRNFVPVQCTKLIFVPPWEGFSPNSSRSSIMESIMGPDKRSNVKDNGKGLNHVENLSLLIHNLDLSYRLEWVADRKVTLKRLGPELGTFQF